MTRLRREGLLIALRRLVTLRRDAAALASQALQQVEFGA